MPFRVFHIDRIALPRSSFVGGLDDQRFVDSLRVGAATARYAVTTIGRLMFDVSRRDLLIRTLDLPESDLMICGAQDLAQRVLRHEYRASSLRVYQAIAVVSTFDVLKASISISALDGPSALPTRALAPLMRARVRIAIMVHQLVLGVCILNSNDSPSITVSFLLLEPRLASARRLSSLVDLTDPQAASCETRTTA
ncbi:hypothetical protein SCLCIDRAFT_29897 [Scleroderma citrinum Foug A]|uniref:Uncharacterized protein n=1 Tax=Scleroderma citrinum Foug A TaxID=1036808 RepID=A0A0C3DIH5_9AGAM|nr:hypothetical protein SCLCIDRAFT_29897 [Scleroderma citrinum Foug A]